MTVQASRMIHAQPGAVWNALTSREGMKAYMMGADVETDWKVGHPITMKGEFKGKAFEDHGEVRSFEPGRQLSYTHMTSATPGEGHLVTFRLAERDGGTEVTVTQAPADGADSAADEKNRAIYEKTWSQMLEALDKAASQ